MSNHFSLSYVIFTQKIHLLLSNMLSQGILIVGHEEGRIFHSQTDTDMEIIIAQGFFKTNILTTKHGNQSYNFIFLLESIIDVLCMTSRK